MRSLSRNILKYHQVIVQEDDKMMIDNNEVVARRLESIEKKSEVIPATETRESDTEASDEFVGGLEADHVEILEESGDDASLLTEDISMERAVFERQAKEMIEEASKQAEQIILQAQTEAENIKESVIESAKAEGFQSGYQEGAAALEEQKKSLEREREQLQNEYQDMADQLEPKFIDVFTDIFSHVFKTDLMKEKGIISHLLSNTLHRIEGSSSYLIHVSKEDYRYVSSRKEEIVSGVISHNATVDIIEDMTLGAGDCMIETEGGVFDCGVGTQLEELTQKLRLLSYTRG